MKYCILFIGNPGSGKSSILNGLTNGINFKSGVSINTGVTKEVSAKVVNNIKYVDTPGLMDLKTKDKNIRLAIETLSGENKYKLVFVFATQHGRMSSLDILTMEHVLDWYKGSDMTDKFMILLNKVPSEIVESESKKTELIISLSKKHKTKHIFLKTFEAKYHDEKNKKVQCSGLKEFLDEGPEILKPKVQGSSLDFDILQAESRLHEDEEGLFFGLDPELVQHMKKMRDQANSVISQSENAVYHKTIEALKSNLNGLENTFKSHKEQYESLRVLTRDLESFQDTQAQKFNQIIHSAEKAFANIKQENDKLLHSLRQTEEQTSADRSSINELHAKVKTLENSVSEKDSIINSMSNTEQLVVAKLRNELSNNDMDISTSTYNVHENQDIVAPTENSNDRNKETIMILIDTTIEKFQSYCEEIKALESKVSVLESNYKNLQENFSSLEIKANKLEDDLNSLKNIIQEKDIFIASMNSKEANIVEHLNNINVEKSLDEKILLHENNLNEANVMEFETHNNHSEEQITLLVESLIQKTAKHVIDVLRPRIKESEKQISELKDQKENDEATIEERNTVIKGKNDAIKHLEIQIEEKDNLITTLKNKLDDTDKARTKNEDEKDKSGDTDETKKR